MLGFHSQWFQKFESGCPIEERATEGVGDAGREPLWGEKYILCTQLFVKMEQNREDEFSFKYAETEELAKTEDVDIMALPFIILSSLSLSLTYTYTMTHTFARVATRYIHTYTHIREQVRVVHNTY